MIKTTLDQLRQMYASGDLTDPLTLDNDSVFVYNDHDKIFDSHPHKLLRDALDLLSIPWEEC